MIFVFFFNDTATTEIYTLSLHDALPICRRRAARDGALLPGGQGSRGRSEPQPGPGTGYHEGDRTGSPRYDKRRSEEHTSELQSRQYLVCRLLLEKKKTHQLATLYTLLLH